MSFKKNSIKGKKKSEYNQFELEKLDSREKLFRVGYLFESVVEEYGVNYGRVYLPQGFREMINLQPKQILEVSLISWNKTSGIKLLRIDSKSKEYSREYITLDLQGRVKIKIDYFKAVNISLWQKIFIENHADYFRIWRPEDWVKMEKKYKKELFFSAICLLNSYKGLSYFIQGKNLASEEQYSTACIIKMQNELFSEKELKIYSDKIDEQYSKMFSDE